jgi:ferredoxin-type protein NapG
MDNQGNSRSLGKKGRSRRQFFASAARGVCGAGALGVGLGLIASNARSHAPEMLRPPGALAEPEFLGACLRCGLCVRDCPYDTLKLAQITDPIANGTPYFIARDVPCEMCDDIPCVAACPSGALDQALDNIDEARMGLAVLIDQETCLNFLGLRCDVCYRVCPLIDEAITLELDRNPRTGHHARFLPTVHSDKCTGCGKCEQACVLEEAAIKVVPIKLAKGELGQHYRLGWEEKAANQGQSLIPEQLKLPIRRPEAEP